MKTTFYSLYFENAPKTQKFAIVADLHNKPFQEVVEVLKKERPDVILILGDLMDDMELRDPSSLGYELLRIATELAPTIYSLGNHEIGCYHRGKHWRKPRPNPLTADCIDRVRNTGAYLLDNDCIHLDGFTYCGLTSGINGEDNFPDPDALRRFENEEGFRILLCHHPEYYPDYLKKTNLDLIVSGHAHGGQWRILGQGIYSPGQGLFPKYTAGIIDDRFVISRGLGNHTKIPRIFNPAELILLTVINSKI